MFRILANTFNTATRMTQHWETPADWRDHDARTRAQKERDAQDQRRWMRQTGIL